MVTLGLLNWMLPFLLLGYTVSNSTAKEATLISAIQDGSVHLSPMIPSKFSPREVFWRHLSPVDHLVASFSHGSSDITYQSCFHGRVQLLQNFTLEILGLQLGDTGMFKCQMVDSQGRMKLYEYYLTVYEAVTKPQVQVFVSKEGQGCSVFLNCNITKGTNVTYSWMTNTGKEALLNETFSLLDGNRLLKIFLTSAHQDVSFICTVTNPVSQEHISVIPWASCLDKPGQDLNANHGKIVLCIAVLGVAMFTVGMFCVFLFTRGSVKKRQKKIIHHEDALLQCTEEAIAQETEEALVEHNTDPLAQQNRTELEHRHSEETLYAPIRKKTLQHIKHTLTQQNGGPSTQNNELTSSQQIQKSKAQHSDKPLTQQTGKLTALHKKAATQTGELSTQQSKLIPHNQTELSTSQEKVEALAQQPGKLTALYDKQIATQQNGEPSTHHNDLVPHLHTQDTRSQHSEETLIQQTRKSTTLNETGESTAQVNEDTPTRQT